MVSSLILRLARSCVIPVGCAVALSAPAVSLRAQGVITGNQTTAAVVETVDPDSHTVLLRDHNGGLISVVIPTQAHALPHLQPGDQINLRFFQTMDAEISQPGSPLPESTVSTARGYVRHHPHGTMVSTRRQRVHLLAIDPVKHVVTFSDADGATRTVTLHTKAMQALLGTLKVGDDVDVTTRDAVSFEVMNRTVTPDATVTEQNGQIAPPPATH
ncbi:hypothetical protein AA103196_2654 [Ameyamaea chiangmaiensis NBRC 103196]|uniref:Preprotein translocase subunit YajC n=1 Tax=Ameyamaea chiangmaiensis TaxID=442969 RepID=A0A850P5N3_9PROT|nr:preprotein translocase subunit YajC [Ameyamaea chiangmaiensis]MBS4074144.1 preprotein translocase subunit YajC [Ameyamaea chiangmaiensis]NVN39955.1 preprotein translocase subunit YajC [Ameyamaea chiangmaiensis]GBQ71026.1 hypothetical protein AA103196_2654 [Ameyamaea chiangmaiensis NBRC 103196]